MEYQGKITNGVVVLDGGHRIPEGTAVRVSPIEDQPSWSEVFEAVAGKAEGLPEDLAENHDHYLHGLPKKQK